MASINSLSIQDIQQIKERLAKGEHQHRIAADYDLNQGRISEIKREKRFAHIKRPLAANTNEPPTESD